MFRVIKTFVILSVIAFIALGCTGSAIESGPQEAKTIKVAATSSQLSSLVKEVGKGRIEVMGPVIPPSICPGHYDVKPSDVAYFEDCRVVFSHSFEPYIEQIIESVENTDLERIEIEVIGSWMSPEKQKEAAVLVKEELVDLDPAGEKIYSDNLHKYYDKIDRCQQALLQELKDVGVSGGVVICQQFQSELMKWMGFEVAGTYTGNDELTPGKIKELIDIGKERGVILVVDHLQAAPGAGREIAQSCGAVQVDLSFFPGGLTEGDDYCTELRANVDAVRQALKSSL